VLTPNGDGVNDAVGLSYLLSQFAGDVRVRLEVCDLRGRRVRTLADGWQSVGRTELLWDGVDDAGRRVPPAVYLCRLEVDSDARGFRRTRTIGVAY